MVALLAAPSTSHSLSKPLGVFLARTDLSRRRILTAGRRRQWERSSRWGHLSSGCCYWWHSPERRRQCCQHSAVTSARLHTSYILHITVIQSKSSLFHFYRATLCCAHGTSTVACCHFDFRPTTVAVLSHPWFLHYRLDAAAQTCLRMIFLQVLTL